MYCVVSIIWQFLINIAVPESMGPMLISATLNGQPVTHSLNSDGKYEVVKDTILTLSCTGNVGNPMRVSIFFKFSLLVASCRSRRYVNHI